MYYPNYLKNSIIIGHTTSRSCKIWVRLEGADKSESYILQISHQGHLVQEIKFNIDSEEVDNIALIKVSNLSANTQYGCVICDDKNTVIYGNKPEERTGFKTLNNKKDDLNFALLSCNQPFTYNKKGVRSTRVNSWNNLRNQNPNFIVHVGDQIYSDAVKEHNNIYEEVKNNANLVDVYRKFYRAHWVIPEIKNVLGNFPNYMTLDDHDIFDGYGSYTNEEKKKYAEEKLGKDVTVFDDIFEAAKSVYGEYQHSHNPDTAKNVFDFVISNQNGEFYFMDLRMNRDINKNVKYRILGQSQHDRFDKWLGKQYESKKQTPIFIVSGVPFVHLKTLVSEILANFKSLKDDIRDHWSLDLHANEFTKVLDQLFDLSRKTKRKVVILSGDVHMSAVFEISSKKHQDTKLYQVTSSAITNTNSALLRYLLKFTSAKKGKLSSDKNYHYKQITNYTRRNFAVINTEFKDIEVNGGADVSVRIFSDRNEVRRIKLK